MSKPLGDHTKTERQSKKDSNASIPDAYYELSTLRKRMMGFDKQVRVGSEGNNARARATLGRCQRPRG